MKEQNMAWNRWVSVGAMLGFSGVLVGAFGAHGLESILGEERATYETGVRYHLVHAAGIIGVGLFMSRSRSRGLQLAAWLLCLGVVIFSGSLYILALSKKRWLGAVTPIGGLCFLIGWAVFAVIAWRGSGLSTERVNENG